MFKNKIQKTKNEKMRKNKDEIENEEKRKKGTLTPHSKIYYK
jgi:hypothetical protein